jgi:hypothetical protein
MIQQIRPNASSWETPELIEAFKEQEKIQLIESNIEKNSTLIRELLGLSPLIDNVRISVDGFGKRTDGSYGWIFQKTYRTDLK